MNFWLEVMRPDPVENGGRSRGHRSHLIDARHVQNLETLSDLG